MESYGHSGRKLCRKRGAEQAESREVNIVVLCGLYIEIS